MVEITSLLATSNYLIVNKDLMRTLGINEAIVLGELASEYVYWKKAGEAHDGWFFSTSDNLEERIPLCRKTIGLVVDNLVEAGLVETKLKGLPARKYYRLNEEGIKKMLGLVEKTPNTVSKKLQQVSEKKLQLGCEKKLQLYKNTEERLHTQNPSWEVGDGENENDSDIPLASTTTHHVEVTVYDSDDDNNCITIKHQVAPREWNKAVRKWRKDISEKVLLTFMDTNETERVSFKRIKKYNVRPRKSDDLGYDRSAGTQFGV